MIFPARFLLASLLIMLLFGCGEKKNISAVPVSISTDSLISPEKMILILSDVHIVESALILERNEGLDPTKKTGYYYQGIFKKYHISLSRYDQNLAYYRQDPEKFSRMYEKVIEVIENRQKKFPEAK